MSNMSLQAAPMSWDAIENTAWQVRENCGITSNPYFNVIRFLEHVLPKLYPDFTYEIVDDSELGDAEGMNCLGTPKIILPESVYEALYMDDGRARFTVAHEIGHLILHPKHRLSLSRNVGEVVPAFRDPEKQANRFAAALLMPKRLLVNYRSATVADIMDIFGVSNQAAEIRMGALRV